MTEWAAGQREEEKPARRRLRAERWHVLAVLLFAAAGLITFRDVLRAGPMSSAIVSSGMPAIASGDVVFEAWLTARNAHTIATAPHRLFDTPHCAPATRTLTLGVPMITMGLLAVPVALFTTNPALAYNVSTFLLLVLSALAMYLLVREWTGVAAAGIVAGLLYAFNPLRVGVNLTHPSTWDSAWLVFALFFSRRFLAHGRWRDAIGLMLACSLQIAACFYPLLAAALMAPAFALWLVLRYGVRRAHVLPLAFALASIVGVSALVLGPYLDARAAGQIGGRSSFFFAQWSAFLPGGYLFLGWGAVVLGAIGLLAPRRALVERIGGDPRWALLAGALMTTAVAAGPFNDQLLHALWPTAPFQIPDLYRLLAAFVPGLDSIRVVARLAVAMQVAVCILAGVGAAWVVRSAGRREPAVVVVLIALALLSIVPEPYPRETVEVRVPAREIRFFQALDASGNRGPILEIPLTDGKARATKAPPRILSTAYHHRRTSACFGSFRAPGREQLAGLVDRLPEPDAVDELRRLGFTTVVVDKRAPESANGLRQEGLGSGGDGLPLLLEDAWLAAYELGSDRR